MNIAYITNFYPPIRTGTAYYVKDLAKKMAERGHKIIVITCFFNSRFSSGVEDGIKVFRLPSIKLPKIRFFLGFDKFYFAFLPGNFSKIITILQTEKVDLLHQCGHLLDLFYFSGRVGKFTKIPTLCSIHTIIHHPSNRFYDFVLKTLDKSIVRTFGVHKYNAILALDNEIRKYVQNYYEANKIYCFPFGLNFDFSKSMGIQNNEITTFQITSVGHVTEMRNRYSLIEAVRKLVVEKGIKVHLSIIGKVCTDEPVRLVRKLGLSHVVEFVGELPRAEVLRRLSKTHVEAHWITNPGIGSAALEAMAIGLPVMAYGYEGILCDVPLKDGENIIFINPNDPDEIADKLFCMWKYPDIRSQIGTNARKLVEHCLTWEKLISGLERLYQKILSDYWDTFDKG